MASASWAPSCGPNFSCLVKWSVRKSLAVVITEYSLAAGTKSYRALSWIYESETISSKNA
jgi:hypothetical protein